MKNGKYLSSIDGLRAISVAAVITFHFFPGLGSAGYLGVDAFFVISGFVISASIANYPTPAGFQQFISRFYLRRIKRLLPALLFMVIVTGLLTILLTSTNLVSLRTGALSIMGVANIHLYLEATNYFGLVSELNPFTHTWSLAVEDQFYIFFPLLVWFLGNRTAPIFDGKRLLVPVLICTAVSLLAFLIIHGFDNTFAFYMMPTRLWQIGAGILTYILVTETRLLDVQTRIPAEVPVTLLISTILFGHFFPTLSHVLIVLFTAASLGLIWLSNRQTILLGAAPVTYIGRISYSLYLWHWPFVVLTKHTVGVSPVSISICLALTFAFAVFSYHCIEKPIRFGIPFPDDGKIIWACRAAIAGALVICLILMAAAPKLGNPRNSLLANAFGIRGNPPYFTHKCEGSRRVTSFESPLQECLGKRRGEADTSRKFYLLGDSHGNHIIPMIKEVISGSGYNLHFINFENRNYGIQALTKSADALPADFNYVIEDSRPGDILAIAFHRGRLNTNRDHHVSLLESAAPNIQTTNLISSLDTILQRISDKKVNIVLLLDTPLMASVTTSQTCAFQVKFSGKSVCAISRVQDLHTRKRQAYAYEKLKEANDRLLIWDPADTIYAEKELFDVVDERGRYLMTDWNHISPLTNKLLAPSFRPVFEALRHAPETLESE